MLSFVTLTKNLQSFETFLICCFEIRHCTVEQSPELSGHLCITAIVTRSQIFSHTNVAMHVLNGQ